jgi:arylsulfatase A-like enzyme/Flp pilus assembly protein TadD
MVASRRSPSTAAAATSSTSAGRPRAWLLGLLAVAAASLLVGGGLRLLGNGNRAAGPVPSGSAAPSDQRPDLVLITIDTLRADALGFAGNPRASTPVLDRLAGAGRVFRDAHAHNVVTLPSHANILTGLYPYQHGVRDNTGFKLGQEVPTAATLLAASGYRTAAFVGAFPLDRQFGLTRGFEVYDDRYPKGSHSTDFIFAQRRGDQVVSLATAWWREHAGRPRFLWLHLYDPHSPYEPPEPFASRFADAPYLGEVAATDAFLAPLLTPLLDGGQPPALVVFTADHGEALGDHGEQTHGLFAYESTLRVPLVLWGAGVRPGVDPRPARHVDLLPTLLAAAGVEPPRGLPGAALTAPPAAAPSWSYFEALSANLNRGWAPLRGVMSAGRKAIQLPLPELYDLARDPGEERNLVTGDRPAARQLFALLPAESSWPPAKAAPTSEEEAGLRSLGYVVGSAAPKSAYGPEDDPKRLVDLDGKLQQVIDLYSRRRLAEAERLAREIVRERPTMGIGYSHLAQVLLEQEKRDEAITLMDGAARRGLASEGLLRQLGLTLAETGQHARAMEILRPLAERAEPDPSTLNAYGLALSEAGRQAEAEAVLRRAIGADPHNAVAYQHLSLAALRRRDWAAALDPAQRALDLNPDLALAWNNLGVARYQTGDRDGALQAWERAVQIDARQFDTLFNLGFKAAEAGRVEQARRVLRQFVATAPAERYRADIEQARALLGRLGA